MGRGAQAGRGTLSAWAPLTSTDDPVEAAAYVHRRSFSAGAQDDLARRQGRGSAYIRAARSCSLPP
jgi:hypothetical protein